MLWKTRGGRNGLGAHMLQEGKEPLVVGGAAHRERSCLRADPFKMRNERSTCTQEVHLAQM